jgi:predicted enzyme related to lactoylglutathione lyase
MRRAAFRGGAHTSPTAPFTSAGRACPWLIFAGALPVGCALDDAGVAAEGSGFRGITLSYIVRSEERVDAVLAEVERAGGKIAKPAQHAPWG